MLCDLYCRWRKRPPIYRLYVNNELFVERVFIWTDHYLEEAISIWTKPGDYQLRYELLPGFEAVLEPKNFRLIYAPQGAYLHNSQTLRVVN